MWAGLIACLTLVADQWTKACIVHTLAPGQSIPILPPVLSLTYVQNTGAAFGLFKGQQLLFIGLSLLVIAWVARELCMKRTLTWEVAWGYALVLGGSFGNLLDRVRVRYVVDFLDVHVWPVFNVGDSAITIGVSLLLIHACVAHGRQETGDSGHG